MSDLLKRLENLSPEKRELVLQKLKQQQSKTGNNQKKQKLSLIPVSREEDIPLSFAQTRLWFLAQFDQENSPYHVPIFWQIKGSLNLKALEQAITEIINRHEILRTTFSVVNESPVQVINPPYQLSIPVINLEGETENIKLEKVRQLATEELQTSFDLSTSPLLRVKLLKINPQFHILLLVIHHIIFDGWSVDLFRQELSTLYSSFSLNKPASLPKLALQYADFAHWQRQWLQGEILETQLNYWRQQLKNAPPLLEFPVDKPRPSVQTYEGSSQSIHLNLTLTQQLKGLSQTSGTTLFMTLLTAFTVLLYRYSGQEDIVIGTAIANRNRQELEPLMGFFVNTLALRTNLQGHLTFSELLQQVKDRTLASYDHQDLPFEKLIDELQIERSLSNHPLFQVFFTLQNESQETLELPGLTISNFDWENKTTLFDLGLICRETPQGLIAELEYRTDLFEAKTIQGIVKHLEVLLQGIIDNPQQSINTLPLLTESNKKQLEIWNQTDSDYFQDQTLVDLFEEQVNKTPDQIALVFEQTSLTYQELNQKANQLAHYLRENYPIEPDSLIGICTERSLEMVIGLLGVLKAGAAYVPIDSDYPEDRIKFILENSKISLLLTQSFLQDKLSLSHLKSLSRFIDLDWFDYDLFPIHNLTVQSKPNDLAYVIYTSGSTGQPKGVMIEHKSIVNFTLNFGKLLDVKPQSRLLQFGSFSFDLSIGEIATSLSHGACLYLAKKETLLPTQTLVEFLETNQITHTCLPPSVLSVLPQAKLSHLENIAVGGEACSAEVIEKWANQRQFFNCYGPTETTVVATLSLCQANGQKPNIGKPLDNVCAYILDGNQQILPPGIPGELCIAGVCLARGYWNRPDLTAEKFVEVNLLGKTERIYKTGDLAKWGDEGNLEFLGRIDQQVKLRGFRIELGEIEAVLLEHPVVKEAVVNLYETENNQQLVAYIIPQEKQRDVRDELKSLLKSRLPNYMIPSQIMILETLPLTPNGKLDKKALPIPDLKIFTDGEMPVTPTEELLASLWQDLLQIKSVGRRDNFFELGGHSLLATQLVTRIRNIFGVELAVRKIFEQSILAELATAIEQENKAISLPPLTPQPPQEPKVLSFAQSRLWFMAQLEGDGTSLTYNMPTALQLEGKLNLAALRNSFEYLLSRHTILRTSFPLQSGEPQILVHNAKDINVLEILDLQELDSQSQTQTVQELIDSDAQYAFDLSKGPLFKAKLLQLNPEKNVLLLNMHHIISDGWSMGVFKNEWEKAYDAFNAGNTPNLAPLPIQYSDYAVWQRHWLIGEVLENQENYWKKQLKDAPKLLDLPTDYPRPAKPSYQGGREDFKLSQRLTEKLKNLSQKQGVSLFMTLFTAFSILLSRYSRQEDLCIGTAIANRTHSYTEKSLGFFVNTLILRSQVKSEQSFSELLQKSRQICLDAYGNQDIPFEYLVEKLQPERTLSYNPLYQVVIVLQNTERSGKSVNLTGLKIEYLEQTYPFSKVDLLLDLTERDGQLDCMWEYATDLFKTSTIKRMAEQFELLLEGIVSNPQQPINTLPLLTKINRQELQFWNQTETDYCQNKTLVDLFEEQVKQNPNSLALVFEKQSLTYQQLNEKANQLAHFLLQHYSIKSDTLISICVERSLEMIIGMLGILKTGSAYVPIDPNYPRDRICLILEDCQATVLLTQSNLQDKLPLAQELQSKQVWCLDEDKFAQYPITNPTVENKPTDLAYVIYTSGSTGQPKGVMIEHQSIVNLSLNWGKLFDVKPQSRLLQFGSFSFDLSIGEIATSLIHGACLYLAKKETLLPTQTLVEFLETNKITHSFLSPSALSVLPKANLSYLENITVGGEICPAEVVEKWANQKRLFNCYGPTEATVTATLSLCQANCQKPNIGKPLDNIRVYILDENQQILPPGIPGELCIAGVCLARGYWNRPDLTSEKFIEVNLLGKTERIYKTGDLAKWRTDGTLEFLGRIDQQVKLRGFRIELGEIETALAQHPNIKESVVILREDLGFDPRLVAYIVPSETGQDSEVKQLVEQQVELWQSIFDDGYYQQDTEIDDPTLNFTGWNDSYTGQPYAKTEMEEWRDKTVELILELAPKRVWEIGCGTGMLLFKIAPYCQTFIGTDFSTKALQYVQENLRLQNLDKKVTLKQSAANQFEGIAPQSYDLVILNSVIQYFPSVDYLLGVLDGVINSIETGGKILIGDVRNFKLLDAFHTAVEFYRADDDLSIKELRQRIRNSLRTEEELLVDPNFFIALKHKYPRISQVQIELKRGYNQTEMNRFRYDVVLYLDQPQIQPLVTEWQWLNWEVEQLSLEKIQRILDTQKPDLLGIQNIPSIRLIPEMVLLGKIPEFEGTVKQLKVILSSMETGINPEALRTLTKDLPYTPFIQYSDREFSTYQVIFQRNTNYPFSQPRFALKQTLKSLSWQDYANQPLTVNPNSTDPVLSNQWRDFLGQTLPDYMIPSHFIQQSKLPLTPNGKIDRKALPAPEAFIVSTDIELPQTTTEVILSAIWSKLLKYEGISRQDNFFYLGGHSLLATQLISRIREQLNIKLSVSKLFEYPVLKELASYLDTCLWVNAPEDSQSLDLDEEEIEL
ncbi:amino acid adenylation domain-containing protein [Microcystis aeruginosa BLCCF158]|uniref:Amino acid adenylation domain-containing protein n=1 Tax=Microcystis aeruginosa BLCC-F158 TaxID=2755316 RepID=A0A841UZC7_MICAE|nr:non-ribosomal peptide synthetase [Microcystis aeruginosa]MBC1194194.1 amino acid adenylation domain-containing protein [Microcystis aeruginosa BLCC-F158]